MPNEEFYSDPQNKGVDILALYQKWKQAKNPQVAAQIATPQTAPDNATRILNTQGEMQLIPRGAVAKLMLYRFNELTGNKPFIKSDLYSTIADYLSKDANFLNANTISRSETAQPDFKKGIAFVGTFGVGKSTLLKCCQQLPSNYGVYLNNGYTDKLDANEFALKYATEGIEVYNRWKNKKVLFIDDVGNEPDTKFYGTDIRVVGRLLFYRYENNLVTHITSNKSPKELSVIYGGHVGDRLHDMFNFFLWNGESKRGV